MREKILCIEDDLTIQTLVAASLREFEVICVKTLAEAEQKLLSTTLFDAILIDIQLPDGDGLRFLTKISDTLNLAKIPVLILSDHTEISNKVMAFSFGADDFIGKPFDPIELAARVSSKVRKQKSQLEQTKIRKLGDVAVDFDRQRAFQVVEGKEKDLQLTGIELKILTLLTKRLEQVYSREQIMQEVWGQTFIADRTVDSHIAHLRQKISSSQLSIETAKNFGYSAQLGVSAVTKK